MRGVEAKLPGRSGKLLPTRDTAKVTESRAQRNRSGDLLIGDKVARLVTRWRPGRATRRQTGHEFSVSLSFQNRVTAAILSGVLALETVIHGNLIRPSRSLVVVLCTSYFAAVCSLIRVSTFKVRFGLYGV